MAGMLASTDIWVAAVTGFAITQVALIATSVYLHRALAHRSLAVGRLADVIFRVILWLTTGQRRATAWPMAASPPG